VKEPIQISSCSSYVEDFTVCFSDEEPKGQCANCGAKWFEHEISVLPESERQSALRIQKDLGVQFPLTLA